VLAKKALNQDRAAGLAPFGKAKKIIDVGGSTGSLAVAITRQHPAADVTVFDFPKVVEIAADNFSKSPHKDRLHVIGGDLTREELPRGFDCIVYAHLFGVFSEANNMKLLERASAALDPGGMCCVLTPVLDETSDGPVSTGLFSSYFLFLANGHGRFYNPGRVRGWMEKAGFRSVETILLPAHEALLIGVK
jgi:cyclopropane fatty-acyl-phospholipid synthase-like methyltransferase